MLKDLSSQKKNEKELVVAAIQALKAKGGEINAYTVAEEAQIPRSTIYRSSELTEMIAQERGEIPTDVNVLTIEEARKAISSLEERNKELQEAIWNLEKHNETLTKLQQDSWRLGFQAGQEEAGRAEGAAPVAPHQGPKPPVKLATAPSESFAPPPQPANVGSDAPPVEPAKPNGQSPAASEPVAAEAMVEAKSVEPDQKPTETQPQTEPAKQSGSRKDTGPLPRLSQTRLPQLAASQNDRAQQEPPPSSLLPEDGKPPAHVYNVVRGLPRTNYSLLVDLSWFDVQAVYNFNSEELQDYAALNALTPERRLVSFKVPTNDLFEPSPASDGALDEPKSLEQRAVDQWANMQRVAEQRAAELKAAEEKAPARVVPDQRTDAQKAAEKRAAERRAAEKLMAAQQSAAGKTESSGQIPQTGQAGQTAQTGQEPPAGQTQQTGQAKPAATTLESAAKPQPPSGAQDADSRSSQTSTSDHVPVADPRILDLHTDVVDLDALDIFEDLDDYIDVDKIDVIPDVVVGPPPAKAGSPTAGDELRELIKGRIQQAAEIHQEVQAPHMTAPPGKHEAEKAAAPGGRSKFIGGAKVGQEPPPQQQSYMTRNIPPEIRRAALILGVRAEEVTREIAIDAWKKQIAAPGVHPDLGGDTEAAVFLNTAKDQLVRWCDQKAPKLGKKFGHKPKEEDGDK